MRELISVPFDPKRGGKGRHDFGRATKWTRSDRDGQHETTEQFLFVASCVRERLRVEFRSSEGVSVLVFDLCVQVQK